MPLLYLLILAAFILANICRFYFYELTNLLLLCIFANFFLSDRTSETDHFAIHICIRNRRKRMRKRCKRTIYVHHVIHYINKKENFSLSDEIISKYQNYSSNIPKLFLEFIFLKILTIIFSNTNYIINILH